eukprot:91887-Chlamydomonas_euryale.AAC.1
MLEHACTDGRATGARPVLHHNAEAKATAVPRGETSYMKERAKMVNVALDAAVPEVYPEALTEAMRCAWPVLA